MILEPVQNAGGCLVPPDGYFERVREICNHHGVLLISDEVICAWGRLGHWFGCQRYGYVPDLITTAKGLTSVHAPMGAGGHLRSGGGAVRRGGTRRSPTASRSAAIRSPPRWRCATCRSSGRAALRPRPRQRGRLPVDDRVAALPSGGRRGAREGLLLRDRAGARPRGLRAYAPQARPAVVRELSRALEGRGPVDDRGGLPMPAAGRGARGVHGDRRCTRRSCAAWQDWLYDVGWHT